MPAMDAPEDIKVGTLFSLFIKLRKGKNNGHRDLS